MLLDDCLNHLPLDVSSLILFFSLISVTSSSAITQLAKSSRPISPRLHIAFYHSIPREKRFVPRLDMLGCLWDTFLRDRAGNQTSLSRWSTVASQGKCDERRADRPAGLPVHALRLGVRMWPWGEQRLKRVMRRDQTRTRRQDFSGSHEHPQSALAPRARYRPCFQESRGWLAIPESITRSSTGANASGLGGSTLHHGA